MLSSSGLRDIYEVTQAKMYKSRITKTLRYLRDCKYDTILDLGCCPGEFGLLLKAKYPQSHIVLADLEAPPIALGDEKISFVKIENLEDNKLPFPDDYFDLVTNLEMIEHLYNPDNLLSEIYRVLKPGGTLILSTPNLASWVNRILLSFGRHPRGLSISINSDLKGGRDFLDRPAIASLEVAKFLYHVRLYTFSSLKVLLEVHGFRVTALKGFYAFRSPHANFMIHLIHVIVEKVFPSMAQGILIEAVPKKLI